MMEALALKDIGAKSKGDITDTIQHINGLDQYQVQDIFPICKLEKAYKSGQAKILINCRNYDIRSCIMTAFHNAQIPACSGPAPAGFVEDELAMWMDTMMDDI